MYSSSRKVSLEKIVDGVPTGLARRLELPDLDGDVAGLKLNGGLTISSFGLMLCLLSWSFEIGLFKPGPFVAAPCAGSLSDGPVNRCTISWKVFESVCTNVVKGLQGVAVWLAGFSIGTLFIQAFIVSSMTCNKLPFANLFVICRACYWKSNILNLVQKMELFVYFLFIYE
ncbi:hypothetical protein PVK06_034434 [Gossypium arboreum]|uniref:Uncharacterized protein n=1 Tax=Gossypium arboreum TaxID=29729 RepID=A0ABR0NF21_GOSAR|nr:hypothetical protein PVK06_034428 [Gossypium arboreum]KAK5793292.1 hypothetical protein PVK06_034434 [Gossypium arboreum]